MTKRRYWPIPEHPNRPIDYTVASTLLRSDSVLHKGQCRADDQMYHGDHKHTRYFVIGLTCDAKQHTFELAVAQEHTFEPLHLTMEEALQYHRVEDCASRLRRPPGHEAHKPGVTSQIVVGKNAGGWHRD